MPRLVINPGSPAEREIQLRPGINSIGRGFANDFKIDEPSVSTTHCHIIVDAQNVLLKDLGSTNGSFVNRSPVKEAALQSGQTVHLGGVEMLFHSDAARSTSPVPSGAPAIRITLPSAPPPVPASAPMGRPQEAETERLPLPPPPVPPGAQPASGGPIRISAVPTARPIPRVTLAAPAAPPPTPAIPPAAHVEDPGEAPPAMQAASGNCKFHPRTAGRYLCNTCQLFFCELCVTSRSVGGVAHKFCRRCGTECVPVQVQVQRPAAAKGFFTRLPGAFIYPFKGAGTIVLIFATLVFAGLDFMASRGMGYGLLFAVIAVGYLFSYMQSIIHCTAAGDDEMASLPGMDGLFGAFFEMAATVAFCFGLPIGLAVAKYFFDCEIPGALILATAVLGCLYFPMAFLAVAMKDTVAAANPLVVMPAIFKVPAEYLVTAILLLAVFAIRFMGGLITVAAKSVGYATRDMSVLFMTLGMRAFWSLLSVYLLTVGMRILGLLYLTKKDKLGWFSR